MNVCTVIKATPFLYSNVRRQASPGPRRPSLHPHDPPHRAFGRLHLGAWARMIHLQPTSRPRGPTPTHEHAKTHRVHLHHGGTSHQVDTRHSRGILVHSNGDNGQREDPSDEIEARDDYGRRVQWVLRGWLSAIEWFALPCSLQMQINVQPTKYGLCSGGLNISEPNV